MTKSNETTLSHWAMDREIVIAKVIGAPRNLVFSAWTDRKQLPKWFCPAGFENDSKEIDIRVGGAWRFEMLTPDGNRYPNRIVFRRIEQSRLIEFDQGSDQDDDSGKFRSTITFDEQSDGKTVVTLRQLHPSKEQRDATIGFGSVEFGYQTLNKLAAHAESSKAA